MPVINRTKSSTILSAVGVASIAVALHGCKSDDNGGGSGGDANALKVECKEGGKDVSGTFKPGKKETKCGLQFEFMEEKSGDSSFVQAKEGDADKPKEKKGYWVASAAKGKELNIKSLDVGKSKLEIDTQRTLTFDELKAGKTFISMGDDVEVSLNGGQVGEGKVGDLLIAGKINTIHFSDFKPAKAQTTKKNPFTQQTVLQPVAGSAAATTAQAEQGHEAEREPSAHAQEAGHEQVAGQEGEVINASEAAVIAVIKQQVDLTAEEEQRLKEQASLEEMMDIWAQKRGMKIEQDEEDAKEGKSKPNTKMVIPYEKADKALDELAAIHDQQVIKEKELKEKQKEGLIARDEQKALDAIHKQKMEKLTEVLKLDTQLSPSDQKKFLVDIKQAKADNIFKQEKVFNKLTHQQKIDKKKEAKKVAAANKAKKQLRKKEQRELAAKQKKEAAEKKKKEEEAKKPKPPAPAKKEEKPTPPAPAKNGVTPKTPAPAKGGKAAVLAGGAAAAGVGAGIGAVKAHNEDAKKKGVDGKSDPLAAKPKPTVPPTNDAEKKAEEEKKAKADAEKAKLEAEKKAEAEIAKQKKAEDDAKKQTPATPKPAAKVASPKTPQMKVPSPAVQPAIDAAAQAEEMKKREAEQKKRDEERKRIDALLGGVSNYDKQCQALLPHFNKVLKEDDDVDFAKSIKMRVLDNKSNAAGAAGHFGDSHHRANPAAKMAKACGEIYDEMEAALKAHKPKPKAKVDPQPQNMMRAPTVNKLEQQQQAHQAQMKKMMGGEEELVKSPKAQVQPKAPVRPEDSEDDFGMPDSSMDSMRAQSSRTRSRTSPVFGRPQRGPSQHMMDPRGARQASRFPDDASSVGDMSDDDFPGAPMPTRNGPQPQQPFASVPPKDADALRQLQQSLSTRSGPQQQQDPRMRMQDPRAPGPRMVLADRSNGMDKTLGYPPVQKPAMRRQPTTIPENMGYVPQQGFDVANQGPFWDRMNA